jgi:nucleoside-diphosphate-sugar epimerase
MCSMSLDVESAGQVGEVCPVMAGHDSVLVSIRIAPDGSLSPGVKRMDFPGSIASEDDLEDYLTRPSAALVGAIRSLTSPLVILGAGGKMGPTLAVRARRAAEAAGHPLEIVAISRFGQGQARDWLAKRGIRTVSADLLDPGAVRGLPDAVNVVYLVGQKFGTSQAPARTWAVNTLIPVFAAERYRHARMVALSTGNVYPLGRAVARGSVESDPLHPVGEYANAAVARERLFEYCSRRDGTAIALIRLFYAVELRYGVLLDLASWIREGLPIPLANGWFNCIWQGDANDMILRSFALAASPPTGWNLCGPEPFAVRDIALRLGVRLGHEPRFSGAESDTALLGNAAPICGVLGTPPTPIDRVLDWVADWVRRGGPTLGRPTHFEMRDGNY